MNALMDELIHDEMCTSQDCLDIDICRWWICALDLDNSSWMIRALEINICKWWIYALELDNSTWMTSVLELGNSHINTSVLELGVR